MSHAADARTAGTEPSATVILAGQDEQTAWQTYVDNHPSAAGYHDWAWRRVFANSFGHESLGLMAHRGGAPCGVLPLVHIRSRLFGRTMTSLPFVNYGGVLADSEGIARALLDHAVRLARDRKCDHLELRHTSRRFPDLPHRQHKVAMRLSIDDGTWNRLDRKVRNQIRKAIKSGLEPVQGGVELLDRFYGVFARNMRDLGTPVYGVRFFREVLEAFPERARVVVIQSGRIPIAAGISYRTGEVVEVPWASSIREFNAVCPNHLLYWTVIQAAVAQACKTLDFGRSSPDQGTYRFKAQWGAEALPLTWEYALLRRRDVPDQSPTNPRYRGAIAAWRRLPLRVANAAGPWIVRSIP